MSLFPDYGPNQDINRPWLQARRILYLNHHGLGDAVNTSAALKSLRDAYPSAYIAATFISEPIAQLFDSKDLIDDYLIFRSGLTNFHVSNESGNPFRLALALAKFLLRVRRLRFELVIGVDNINPKLLAALGKLAGIRWIVGECPKGTRTSRFFSRYTEHKIPHLPHLQAALAILHSAGIPVSCQKPVIPLTDDNRRGAREWLEHAGFLPRERFAVIHAAAGWGREQKQWPLEKFGELGRWFGEQLGMRTIFLGTEDERGVIDQVIKYMPGNAINAAGVLDLRQVAAVVEKAIVVVGNDSGMVHLAGALGVPTVALYGPTDDVRARPYGTQVRTIRNKMPCSPCDSVLPFGCGLPICINSIEVAQVREAVMELIEDRIHSASDQLRILA
jgi:heptosyltransferase-2